MKNNLIIIKSITSSNRFALSLLVLILLNFFMIGKYSTNTDYLNAFIDVNNLFAYNFFVAIVLLISTLNVLHIFENYKNIIIRYKNKRKFFVELIKLVLILNFIIIIINYMLLFTGLNFFAGPIKITNINGYNITTLVYSIYVLIKKILLFEMLSMFFLLLNKNFNKNLSLIISTIITLSLFMAPYHDVYINSFSNFQIFYWDYFVFHKYSSFMLETSFFGIYFCINFYILYMLSILTIKKLKIIGE